MNKNKNLCLFYESRSTSSATLSSLAAETSATTAPSLCPLSATGCCRSDGLEHMQLTKFILYNHDLFRDFIWRCNQMFCFAVRRQMRQGQTLNYLWISSGDICLLTVARVHGTCNLPTACTREAAALQERGTATWAWGSGVKPDGGPSASGEGTEAAWARKIKQSTTERLVIAHLHCSHYNPTVTGGRIHAGSAHTLRKPSGTTVQMRSGPMSKLSWLLCVSANRKKHVHGIYAGHCGCFAVSQPARNCASGIQESKKRNCWLFHSC